MIGGRWNRAAIVKAARVDVIVGGEIVAGGTVVDVIVAETAVGAGKQAVAATGMMRCGRGLLRVERVRCWVMMSLLT